MNKGDLVDIIAKNADITKKQAGEALNTTLESITKELKKGGKVTLIGFGTFDVSKRAARKGRNPRTGEPLKIKASKNARFKAGAGLKGALNPRRKK
jgi:DNA-binding protein HU-beta